MEAAQMREAGGKFVQSLQAALQSRTLYGEAHPLTAEAVAAAYAVIAEVLASQQRVNMGVIGSCLVFDRQPLHGLAGGGQGLVTCLLKAKVQKVVFGQGVRRDELDAFLALMASCANADRRSTDALDTSRMPHIMLDGIVGETGAEPQSQPESQTSEAALRACAADYAKGVDLLGDVARALGDGRPFNAAAASAFVGRIVSRAAENKNVLLIGASLKQHDPYSFVHSANVAVLSLVQGQSLGLGANLLAGIGMAGFLHDAGKLALAGQVLRKSEKLTEEEFDQVRLHPLDGAKILALTPDVHPLVALAAFEHHLRYDMSGYPRKVFGELGLASMIVAIADVYDALRSNRSYREGMAPERVYEEMRKMSGTHFHPDLLEAFFLIVGVYPPGTIVELDDGHIGIVVEANGSERTRPKVEVFHRKDVGSLRHARVIDLAQRADGGGYRRTIVRSVPQSEGYAIPERYRVKG